MTLDFRTPEGRRRLEQMRREHDMLMARIRARQVTKLRILEELDRNIEAMKRQAGML